MILVDTNIIARHLLNDIPDHSRRATELFARAARGEIDLFVPATAIAELTWLLVKQKRIPKQLVVEALIKLFSSDRVHVENHVAVLRGLEHFSETGGVSYVDSYHLALAETMGISQVLSFDKGMARYQGVERIEP